MTEFGAMPAEDSHRRQGAKVCPWMEDLETMLDRFIGTMSAAQKEAWNLRWGTGPVTWCDVTQDTDP